MHTIYLMHYRPLPLSTFVFIVLFNLCTNELETTTECTVCEKYIHRVFLYQHKTTAYI